MPQAASRLLYALLLCLMACIASFAQGSTAQISGVISDTRGAVLPGVDENYSVVRAILSLMVMRLGAATSEPV
jgi:hypothetical protein